MEEYVFYLSLTIVLMVVHQIISFAILGAWPLSVMKEATSGAIGSQLSGWQVTSMVGISMGAALVIQPLLWMVLPAWLMVSQTLIFEVWAIRSLLRMRQR